MHGLEFFVGVSGAERSGFFKTTVAALVIIWIMIVMEDVVYGSFLVSG